MKLSDADAIIALVGGQNGLIPAIKEYRRVTGCSLRDAEDAIDKHRLWGDAAGFDAEGFRRENVDNLNPLVLLAEFKVHVHKLEQIIARFAELCDQHEGADW